MAVEGGPSSITVVPTTIGVVAWSLPRSCASPTLGGIKSARAPFAGTCGRPFLATSHALIAPFGAESRVLPGRRMIARRLTLSGRTESHAAFQILETDGHEALTRRHANG